jgi:hypothetical protein
MKKILYVLLMASVVAPAVAENTGRTRSKEFQQILTSAIKPDQPKPQPKERRTLRTSGLATPPPGLKWLVIQPADFRENRMYQPDTSELQVYHIGTGPVLRSAHVHPGISYDAMAPVRLPDGARIKWIDCHTEGKGSGNTRIKIQLLQHWYDDMQRSARILKVSINAVDAGQVKSYRGYTSLQPEHTVDNTNTFYLLKASFSNEGGKGQGLRACRIGYR